MCKANLVVYQCKEGNLRDLPPDRSKSLRVRVTERLRRAILDGEFPLGQPLSEDKLAKAFGVSRTPVRNAITSLQLQGLIEVQPQRGSFVFLPSEEDIAKLCEFREMIEIRALTLCYEERQDATLAQMKRANVDIELATEKNDRLAFTRADGELHDVLFENCQNKYLIDAYKLVSSQVAALRGHSRVTDMRRAMNEHKAIIEAMANDDLPRAQQVLSQHILKMREVYALSVKSAISSGSGEEFIIPAVL